MQNCYLYSTVNSEDSYTTTSIVEDILFLLGIYKYKADSFIVRTFHPHKLLHMRDLRVTLLFDAAHRTFVRM